MAQLFLPTSVVCMVDKQSMVKSCSARRCVTHRVDRAFDAEQPRAIRVEPAPPPLRKVAPPRAPAHRYSSREVIQVVSCTKGVSRAMSRNRSTPTHHRAQGTRAEENPDSNPVDEEHYLLQKKTRAQSRSNRRRPYATANDDLMATCT